MRKFLKWGVRILTVVVLTAVALGLWKREEITRLMAVNSLFSKEKIVGNFSGMNQMFLTVPVLRGAGPVRALPRGPEMTLPEGAVGWIEDSAVTALVVLKDGQLIHESYYLGTNPDDLRISWSVAKSYLSALLGIVMAEGQIASLDDPVTKYAPELKGSAYENASILNVLQMQSGVKFNEDYLDFDSDINRMGRVLAMGGSMDGFAADLSESDAKPGANWQYVSIDTHVIGMVIRGATGRNIPDLMSEKLLQPLGLEAEPYFITDGYGTAFVLGGLNLRTRDYARFGQMILQGGMWFGQQIVPSQWIDISTKPSARTKPGKMQYGYQWWMPSDAEPGEFLGQGVYGQYIYINRRLNAVVTVNSANKRFRETGVGDANIAMMRAIAAGK